MLLRHPRLKVTLSLTPLIDVVFILLVFFMLASQFSEWKQITLSPSSTNGPASRVDEAAHALRLLNTGEATLDGNPPQKVEHLLATLTAMQARVPIFLSTEANVELQALVNVVEKLNAAGFNELSVVDDAQGG